MLLLFVMKSLMGQQFTLVRLPAFF